MAKKHSFLVKHKPTKATTRATNKITVKMRTKKGL